jgi:hypothetical protein
MFRDEFQDSSRAEQFSYEALGVLYDYYNELDDMEIDIIAICCEWTETSLDDVLNSYSLDSIEELDTTYYELQNGDILYLNY